MIVTPTTTSVEAMTMIKMIFTIRVDKSSFVGDVEFVMGVEFFGDVVFVFVSPRASPRYGQRWRQVSALLALRRLRRLRAPPALCAPARVGAFCFRRP